MYIEQLIDASKGITISPDATSYSFEFELIPLPPGYTWEVAVNAITSNDRTFRSTSDNNSGNVRVVGNIFSHSVDLANINRPEPGMTFARFEFMASVQAPPVLQDGREVHWGAIQVFVGTYRIPEGQFTHRYFGSEDSAGWMQRIITH
jgi:hypothetical protein